MRRLSFSLPVCLFVSKITEKVVDGSGPIFQGRWTLADKKKSVRKSSGQISDLLLIIWLGGPL